MLMSVKVQFGACLVDRRGNGLGFARLIIRRDGRGLQSGKRDDNLALLSQNSAEPGQFPRIGFPTRDDASSPKAKAPICGHHQTRGSREAGTC